MIKFSNLLIRIVNITGANYTAGTRVTVAHGLGYTPNIDAIIVQEQSSDADADNVCKFALVKADATNVYLKPLRTIDLSGGSPTVGKIMIFADKDIEQRRVASA